MTANVELLRAENKRLANALQSLLRYVERCREAGVLVCDDIGPEEFARYELEQALSLPPEQPAAAQQGQAVDLAPPSAPVGVELSALRVQEWLQREYDILPPVQEIEQAMRTPCSCPDTERALAQQPAAVAVDEAMVDRACAAYAQIADDCMGLVRRKAMRAALTAALATQQQEPTT